MRMACSKRKIDGPNPELQNFQGCCGVRLPRNGYSGLADTVLAVSDAPVVNGEVTLFSLFTSVFPRRIFSYDMGPALF